MNKISEYNLGLKRTRCQWQRYIQWMAPLPVSVFIMMFYSHTHHKLAALKKDTSGIGKILSLGKLLLLLNFSFTFCKMKEMTFIWFFPWMVCENFINICTFELISIVWIKVTWIYHDERFRYVMHWIYRHLRAVTALGVPREVVMGLSALAHAGCRVSHSGHIMSLANVSSQSSRHRHCSVFSTKGIAVPCTSHRSPKRAPRSQWFVTFTGLERTLVNGLEITAPLSQQSALNPQSPQLSLQPKVFFILPISFSALLEDLTLLANRLQSCIFVFIIITNRGILSFKHEISLNLERNDLGPSTEEQN